jgi:hypothetical protein
MSKKPSKDRPSATPVARKATPDASCGGGYCDLREMGITTPVFDEGVLKGKDPDSFFEQAANGRVWSREPKVRTVY